MYGLVICLVGILCASSAWAGSHREQLICNSWRFNVEVNNLQGWKVVPVKCEDNVAEYMTGSDYLDDSEAVADVAIAYAEDFVNDTSTHRDLAFTAGQQLLNPKFTADGKLCWVFDVDETSLSNLPYYKHHRFGAEAYNDTLFEAWVVTGKAPPIPGTVRLIKILQKLGYSVFFLTGRDESQREVTAQNLAAAGYSGWEALLLRQKEDHGTSAVVYKSKNRKELEDNGCTIVGNVGDQWSDLSGYSIGNRVFKMPNPMYYIS